MPPGLIIDAPHPVYGLQWTADGERLAYCGGFLYGGGFLGLAYPNGQIIALRDQASLTAEETPGDDVILSALCVDDTGSWILAAACSYKWHARAPLLFRVDDDRLSLVAIPERPGQANDEDDEDDEDDELDVQRATGAWIHRGELLVRYVSSTEACVLLRWSAPAELHASSARNGHSSARVTVVDDTAWAPKNQIHRYSSQGKGAPMTPGSDARLILEPHGILAVDLRGSSTSAPLLRSTDRAERTQALTRDRSGEHLYAGLRDGQIIEWRIVGRDRLERRRSWQHSFIGGRSAPLARGIQAMCQLADGETLVSAHVSGTIALWRDGLCVERFTLPDPWSPRTLAAHPSEPLLAVGCKGRQGYDPGSVLLYDLSAKR